MNPAARHIRQDDASAGGVRSGHGSQRVREPPVGDPDPGLDSSSLTYRKAQTNNAERDRAECLDDNSRNTSCGIVRHTTLWLEPELVGQFEFLEWTQDGHLRHARFMGLREEGQARDVGRKS
jgi:ATP-dependent DNA ligase